MMSSSRDRLTFDTVVAAVAPSDGEDTTAGINHSYSIRGDGDGSGGSPIAEQHLLSPHTSLHWQTLNHGGGGDVTPHQSKDRTTIHDRAGMVQALREDLQLLSAEDGRHGIEPSDSNADDAASRVGCSNNTAKMWRRGGADPGHVELRSRLLRGSGHPQGCLASLQRLSHTVGRPSTAGRRRLCQPRSRSKGKLAGGGQRNVGPHSCACYNSTRLRLRPK